MLDTYPSTPYTRTHENGTRTMTNVTIELTPLQLHALRAALLISREQVREILAEDQDAEYRRLDRALAAIQAKIERSEPVS